jgi:hypothetical protein
MSPEDRAKAVIAYFPAVPEKIRPPLEEVITRAIKRALRQQLAELERLAAGKAKVAEGRKAGGSRQRDATLGLFNFTVNGKRYFAS